MSVRVELGLEAARQATKLNRRAIVSNVAVHFMIDVGTETLNKEDNWWFSHHGHHFISSAQLDLCR